MNLKYAIPLLIGTVALLLPGFPAAAPQERRIEGWTVSINERLLSDDAAGTDLALELLAAQLKEIVRVVPAPAVEKLRKVKLWLSPEYPGTGPRAEYHPGAGWLRENGRDPAMVKGVEFTNVRIFPAEIRRMPNFVLHELAHAYHDQILGNNHQALRDAYEKAKAGGSYERLERQDAEGRKHIGRAYALTNPQEYFAEATEAFFVRNDFYPYRRSELEKHDPELHRLLAKLWDAPLTSPGAQITPPLGSLKAAAFYKKSLLANGYPILSSEKVDDYALKEAAYLINLMLARRPDVRQAMIQSGSRLCIIGYQEFTTDLPGWEHMKPKEFWDARARGMGGSETDPLCSCGEENLLGYAGDPYAAENILIHEFAHNIHLRGMSRVDPGFDERVKAAHAAAMAAGLWEGKYASVNHHEYFAEGVQSWFDNNRENDHDHNHVNTRAELTAYDPGLAALCREVFGDTELRYTKPATRLRDHLAGYDPALAPRFAWPARLDAARAEIRKQAVERSKGNGGRF
ncbi:MAG: zinc-dependent peptidase [Actinomycetota bacterium]